MQNIDEHLANADHQAHQGQLEKAHRLRRHANHLRRYLPEVPARSAHTVIEADRRAWRNPAQQTWLSAVDPLESRVERTPRRPQEFGSSVLGHPLLSVRHRARRRG